MTDALRLAFAQKEREMALLLALDHVRDSLDDGDDPQTMFKALVDTLKQHFAADACALLLLEETSDDVEALAAAGVPDDLALTLCRLAMDCPAPCVLDSGVWEQAIGVRIILDRELHPLGGFFLARKSRSFDDADLVLLRMAESQIDSAVVQARIVWKLAQRNRELEAIYRIDRLRDDAPDERTLIDGFTAVLKEHFKATFSMLVMTDEEEGQPRLRSISDAQMLPGEALQAIVSVVNDIRIPQVIPTPPEIGNLVLMAAPFVVGGERLGAVIVGRDGKFTVADHRLMFAISSQMDSAVMHNRTRHQVARHNFELETIYRIDQIRDLDIEFDDMLQQVLGELCRAISSEIGYLMLYNEGGETGLELKAITREGISTDSDYTRALQQASREALDSESIVWRHEPDGVVRSIIAIPLILNERVIGVFGAINSTHPHGFSREDRHLLKAITSQVDTAVFERIERRRMRRVLKRSVDPKVLEKLLQQADDRVLAGERVVLSVLFADLRNSTEWAERTEPEELVRTLNEFLSRMTDVIFAYGGTLDKFVGDEVIALFGTPILMEDHAYKAAQCGLEMQRVQQELLKELAAQGRELPPMGVGISSGEVIAGEFGPPIRTDFTAMGRIVNLGSRLCGAAGAGQVLINQGCYEFIREFVAVSRLDSLNLKGIHQAVDVYELTGLRGK